MSTLLLLMASYGMCFGLMNEKVEPINRVLYWLPTDFFYRMFECAYCTGFHTGWITWVIWWASGGSDLGTGSGPAGAILFAFVSSVFCYALDVALTRLETTE